MGVYMKKFSKLLTIFLICFCANYSSYALSRLLIKIPTRSRPNQFFRILDLYYKHLSNPENCKFLITCDIDDYSMNNDQVKKKLQKYTNLNVHFSSNTSKIEAYNKDINSYLNDFDIMLVTSDDAEPIVKGYDKIIAETMLKSFPDYDGILNFSDGYVGAEVNTLPIIGKKYYERFGYIYHPSYKGFWCDNELTLVSKILKREFISNQVLIRHNHPANNSKIPNDSLYAKNQKWFDIDRENFRKRQRINFNLKFPILRLIQNFDAASKNKYKRNNK